MLCDMGALGHWLCSQGLGGKCALEVRSSESDALADGVKWSSLVGLGGRGAGLVPGWWRHCEGCESRGSLKTSGFFVTSSSGWTQVHKDEPKEGVEGWALCPPFPSLQILGSCQGLRQERTERCCPWSQSLTTCPVVGTPLEVSVNKRSPLHSLWTVHRVTLTKTKRLWFCPVSLRRQTSVSRPWLPYHAFFWDLCINMGVSHIS